MRTTEAHSYFHSISPPFFTRRENGVGYRSECGIGRALSVALAEVGATIGMHVAPKAKLKKNIAW